MGFTDTETILMDWLIKRGYPMPARKLAACHASLAAAPLTTAALLARRGVRLMRPSIGVAPSAPRVTFAIHARRAVNDERIRRFARRLRSESMRAERITRLGCNPRQARVASGGSPRDPVRGMFRELCGVLGWPFAQCRRNRRVYAPGVPPRRCG